MAPPSLATPVSQTLSAQQVEQVKKQAHGVLNYIVNANSITEYFRDVPLLSKFRAERGRDGDWNAFAQSVPLSTYDDYRPYISRFMDDPCRQASVENLLAPGLPTFIATSSGTSGGVAKYYPKYTHPANVSQTTLAAVLACGAGAGRGTACVVFSLRHALTRDVLDDAQGVAKTIPFSLASAGLFRGYYGWAVENDDELVKTRPPGHVTPLAAAYIKPYDSFLLTHALFALAERHWEELVRAIETGRMLELDGLDGLLPHLQVRIPRAAPGSRRRVEEDRVERGSLGWLKQVWPNLPLVVGNTSGSFSAMLPRVQHHLGPTIGVQNAAYGSSEAWIGVPYNPEAGDSLYKVLGTDDVIEYLDVEQPESAEFVIQSWDLVVGRKYEVILTTRDGFWRYRLGDVLEVAGFRPRTGRRWSDSRSAGSRRRLADVLGAVMEFSVVVDDRTFPRRYGFLLELEGEPGQLDGRRAECADRGPGTFGAYRSWRIQVSGSGGGQVKVPTIVYSPEVRDWIAGRVHSIMYNNSIGEDVARNAFDLENKVVHQYWQDWIPRVVPFGTKELLYSCIYYSRWD
ncbi:GH3 auxin-responsive promoter-domain-containing protein [Infundibulicybe gibba]|nr:GH3 auxin-responsive promoter-domain-containing protein [Infundibulicybe gibba]